MQSDQTIGIDLPLKILVWQDASGATWLSYNDPRWLAKRHGLSADFETTVSALATDALFRMRSAQQGSCAVPIEEHRAGFFGIPIALLAPI